MQRLWVREFRILCGRNRVISKTVTPDFRRATSRSPVIYLEVSIEIERCKISGPKRVCQHSSTDSSSLKISASLKVRKHAKMVGGLQ